MLPCLAAGAGVVPGAILGAIVLGFADPAGDTLLRDRWSCLQLQHRLQSPSGKVSEGNFKIWV
jgi:hypothetical protein